MGGSKYCRKGAKMQMAEKNLFTNCKFNLQTVKYLHDS